MVLSVDTDSNRVALLANQGEKTTWSPLIVCGTAFLFSFGILALFWYLQVRPYYSPYNDEFSLFVHSTRPFHPVFSEWFLQGFSQYFLPYPEWSTPSTNFLRPVANAEYYLSSLVFGTHWNWYLLSTYCIQSALVAAMVHLSLRHLRLPISAALGIGFLCFVSPAFDYGAIYSTSFAFDLLAALLVLAGLDQLLSRRILLAWIFFSLAVFTKETAFFAPLAAAIVTHRMSKLPAIRRLVAPACFLLPYAAWAGLRQIAFHGPRAGGVYAVSIDRPAIYLPRVLKQFLRWPIPFDVPYRTASAPVSASALLYVFAFMNLCFWMGVVYLSFRLLHARIHHKTPLMRDADLRVTRSASPIMWVMILFCSGSVAILLLIPNLQPRFGATLVPLFVLTLVTFMRASTSGPLRALACILLIIPPMIQVTERALHFSDDLAFAHLQWRMAADYLQKLSSATASTVYVVDDVSGSFSSPESVSKFAGYRGQLVRVNDITFQQNCAIHTKVDIQKVTSDRIKVTSTIDSPCAAHAFLFGRPDYPTGSQEFSRSTAGAKIIYHGVPVETVQLSLGPSRSSLELIDVAVPSLLLVADFESKAYREIRLF
jgi:hypothetical protein